MFGKEDFEQQVRKGTNMHKLIYIFSILVVGLMLLYGLVSVLIYNIFSVRLFIEIFVLIALEVLLFIEFIRNLNKDKKINNIRWKKKGWLTLLLF